MSKTDLIVTTAQSLDGYRIAQHLGIVRGIVVRSPGFAKGLVGGLKSLFNGNISQFEEVCETAREQASDRMIEHARQLGANAIIAMRYDATEFSQGQYVTIPRLDPGAEGEV
jgi:uncharacterized protein YbjQ (UPF0145 family)